MPGCWYKPFQFRRNFFLRNPEPVQIELRDNYFNQAMRIATDYEDEPLTMVGKKQILVYITIIFFSAVSFGQTFKTEMLTAKDGIAGSNLFITYQDSFGFLWVSAYTGGLSRYDGRSFVNYGINDGIPNMAIDAIFMDSYKRLWIGTRSGIVELEGKKFIAIPYEKNESVNFVFGFFETKQYCVWALTAKGIYELQNKVWHKVKLFPPFVDNGCRNIVETNKGMFINYGTVLLFSDSLNSYKILGKKEWPPYYFNQLKKAGNDVYISIQDSLFQINEKNERKLLYKNETGLFKYFVDSKKRLWIATGDGGLKVSKPGIFTHFEPVYKNSSGGILSNIFEDKWGNIWASYYTGLLKIHDAEFTKYALEYIKEANGIQNIFVTGTGDTYINSDSSLIRYKKHRFIRKYLFDNSIGSKQNEDFSIDFIASDSKGKMWFINRQKRLLLFENNRIFHVPGKLFDAHANTILYDKFRKGLIICNQNLFLLKNGKSVPLLTKSFNDDNEIRLICQQENGNIFFSTAKGNIYLLDVNNVCSKQYREFREGNNLLISVLTCDTDGSIWLSPFGVGLKKYRLENGQLVLKKTITKSDGLPNDFIEAICYDRMNRMWISTSSGLAVLEKGNSGDDSSYKIISVFTPKYLNVFSWTYSHLAMDSSGKILLSTYNDFIVIDAKKMNFSRTGPNAIIESMHLNFQETNWQLYTDSLFGMFQLPVNAFIPFSKNSVSISFAGITSSEPTGVQYSYRLNNTDTIWHSPSENNSVSFVKLPPGNYQFQVKARLPYSDWGTPASVSFTILKPVWQTWWFRFSIIITTTGLVFILFRQRIQTIKKNSAIKRRLLETELKALRTQMNPHFIFNSLNSINRFILQNNRTQASEYLTKFSKLVRMILQNSQASLITLESELESLKLYLEMEALRFDNHFTYNISVSDELDSSVLRIPPLIIQPYVENAIWHGLMHKEEKGKLDIEVSQKNNFLFLKITDDGIGRKKAAELVSKSAIKHKSMGLRITAERIAIMQSGNDSPSPVVINDLVNADGSAAGTEVIIKIPVIYD
jgi:ligand-binding sensor domain-containing protein